MQFQVFHQNAGTLNGKNLAKSKPSLHQLVKFSEKDTVKIN